MLKEKSNTQHLRSILLGFSAVDTTEAIEFLDSIEEEIDYMKQQVCDKESDIDELNDKIEEFEKEGVLEFEPHFVGLDTIHIHLEQGNLKIQDQVERFIETLKKQNAVVPA